MKNLKTYVGSTKDLRKRLTQHNGGTSISTKADKPWRVAYYEAFAQESLARMREKRLKYDGNAMRELKKRIGLRNKSGAARGFSTLEMMIAMAVMVMILSAVILVSFSNQGALVGGETNAEAMTKAQALLEQEQQLARKDFRLVNSFATTTDGIYKKWTFVEPWSSDPYSMKKVSTFVTWEDQRKITRSLILTTLLSDFTNAVGGDTCSSAPVGDWSAPQGTDYKLDSSAGELLAPAGLPVGETYTVGGLDAYRGKLYVGAAQTSASNDHTFFVFGIPNPPQKPAYIGSLDTSSAGSGLSGINAVQAGNTVLVPAVIGVPHSYVYVANGYKSNFDSCTTAAGPAGGSCAQMQVIDVTDPTTPTVAANFKFATSSTSVPNTLPYVNGNIGGANPGQAVGSAIFYRDGNVYLGLAKTASGPEFHIIDVHNPSNPIFVGSYPVGASIESIYVRGKYAYLATDNDAQDLIVLDIGTDPANPSLVSGVFNPGGLNGGSRTYAVGDALYFGKKDASGPAEFYKLDITNTASGIPTPSMADRKVIGASVMGLIIRDTLAFLVTAATKQLQILDLTNLAAAPATLTLPGTGAGLECELNYLYAGSNSGGNGYISVIKPS